MNGSVHQKYINVVAIVPPPHNGMTAVSRKFVTELSSQFSTNEFLVSKPGFVRRELWPIYRQLAIFSKLIEALCKTKGPIYFVLDSNKGIWANLLLHLPLFMFSKRPLILHHHVFSYLNSRDARVGWISHLLGERAMHVVLCTCMQEKLQTLYPGARNAIAIGNARFLNIETTHRESAALNKLGFLGNISREKGVHVFMDTVRRLSVLGVTLEAEIAGPIADKSVWNDIEAFVNEAPDSRSYIGPVYGGDKDRFLAGVDVLLFPSEYSNEAQPVTIFEGIASGMPVLATNIGCIPEQLPKDWVFSRADFVEKAAHLLEEWCRMPAKFFAATQEASSRWRSEQSEAVLQYNDFVELVDAHLA
ncbi:glycosyltransferase family 4 protein [Algiphilus aromaticivorans]|uniref:glycosyltransferase family 4 protein n=1 Tax=Algiphilus aromaticivorans TaxID=382454 RepID=UPI0009FCE77C|nr:glycosyltransferase family 4 protein [Algiphilus aromaticivorans]